MNVELGRVTAIHVFVGDWIAAAHFWARMTGVGTVHRIPFGAVVRVGSVEMIFCTADPRNPVGGSPVPYFVVAEFNDARAELRDWGCVEIHYPLRVGGGEQIAQFRDPFGTIFGIQGPPESPFWPEAQAEIEILRRRS